MSNGIVICHCHKQKHKNLTLLSCNLQMQTSRGEAKCTMLPWSVLPKPAGEKNLKYVWSWERRGDALSPREVTAVQKSMKWYIFSSMKCTVKAQPDVPRDPQASHATGKNKPCLNCTGETHTEHAVLFGKQPLSVTTPLESERFITSWDSKSCIFMLFFSSVSWTGHQALMSVIHTKSMLCTSSLS